MQELAREGVTALLRAAGGGLLLAFVAWIACRFIPRLPVAVRFALWWLVGAKLVLGLFFALGGVTALRVPVLSAEHYYRLQVLAKRTIYEEAHSVARKVATPVVAIAPSIASDPNTGWAQQSYSAPSVSENPTPISRLMRLRNRIACYAEYGYPFLALCYFGGVLVMTAKLAGSSAALRHLLQDAFPCEDTDLLQDAECMAKRLGLRRVPTILLCERLTVPLITGIIHPKIYLPVDFLFESVSVRRMALAHEMGHIKRSDLLLSIVSCLSRVLFWFLPPAHLAVQEAMTAREEACDLLAVAACDTSASAYGNVLVAIASQQKAALPSVALGMATPSASSPGFALLKRRLQTLKREANGKPIPLLWRGIALILVGVQGAVTLLPLRPALARVVAEAQATVAPLPTSTRYTLTDLGTLGGRHSGAFAVNDAGMTVGTANVFPLGGRGHAFLHNGKQMVDLTEGSSYRHSFALAVNDEGTVAGAAFRSSYRSSEQVPFVWKGKRRIYLSPAEGYRFGRAMGINASGLVVGASLAGGKDAQGALSARATLWQDGKPVDIGTLGGRYSYALGVNDAGVVVGKADAEDLADGTRRTHAFLYDPATKTVQDLQTLGGLNSVACGINEEGQAVGYAETVEGQMHAFVRDPSLLSGGMNDLGTLAGGESQAYAVNDAGTIVGQSQGEDGRLHAVVWSAGKDSPLGIRSRITDLNDCLTPETTAAGWHLETARGINAGGQIVGQGTINGKHHAILLTPVK